MNGLEDFHGDMRAGGFVSWWIGRLMEDGKVGRLVYTFAVVTVLQRHLPQGGEAGLVHVPGQALRVPASLLQVILPGVILLHVTFEENTLLSRSVP